MMAALLGVSPVVNSVWRYLVQWRRIVDESCTMMLRGDEREGRGLMTRVLEDLSVQHI